MKIRLIEPISPSRHLWSKSYFVRLGLPMIGAALVEAGHDVRIFNPQLAPIDWADVYSSDLVGLSSTTSTIIEAYRIADDLRGRGIPVIIGGSHVTFMADEALQHADYVARGEAGEIIMAELAECLEGKREIVSITGISYTGEDGKAVHAPLHDRCPDLDLLPFPDLTLVDGWERISNTPIMTSWGCPFDCTFCSVTAMFGKKYRFRSAESVVAEIKQKDPERIFFYDDNMAANRKRLKRLLQLMIDEGVTVPWGAQVRTDVVRDPELMELMRASKCEFVALGLESVNQATLDGFEKSQTVDDIEHAIKVLHDYGIRTPRHVRAGRRPRHAGLGARHGQVREEEQDRHGDAQHPHAAPRHAAVRGAGRRGPHPRARLVVLRRAARGVPAQADDAAAPAAGDHQGQQELLRHVAPDLAVPQVAVDEQEAGRRAQEGVLGPHARVRLALVLLAHVVDGREEPRAAPPPARAQQGTAAGHAPRRPVRRHRGLHHGGRGRRRRHARRGVGAAAGLIAALAPSAGVPAARPGNSPCAGRAAGSGARHPRPQDGTMATATFAAGCFWGVEQRFAALPGVTSTEVGYTGGTTENPTYKQVCANTTGHAEAVRLEFDPEQVSYEELLAAFFGMHDPTQWNRQGPDFGSQYRSAVFFHDEEQEKAARAAIEQLTESGVFKRKIVTLVEPAGPWWRAEEYHQKYFEKHAGFSCNV